jgi:hypothetical protein
MRRRGELGLLLDQHALDLFTDLSAQPFHVRARILL